MPRTIVVGAGIAGVACARELANPRVLDRGQRIGGRMAVRTLDGRPVDVGAPYFTARDPAFRAVVDDWVTRGLARPWTDTFHVATPEGITGTSTGPMRYVAQRGLRSLVEDFGVDVEHPRDVAHIAEGPHVDGDPAEAVVLAMPGPQALRLLADAFPDARAAADVPWEPSLALIARWGRRHWPAIDGVFVNDSPVLTFIADDGSRREDAEPLLVAYADAVLAARHLADPAKAAPVMLAELQEVLGIDVEPERFDVKRWTFARPVVAREEPFFLDGPVGLCGDGWHGPSRVEAAYLSGRALGLELTRRSS
jgi:predicted NAD/FAD-dependent oxidoreductase